MSHYFPAALLALASVTANFGIADELTDVIAAHKGTVSQLKTVSFKFRSSIERQGNVERQQGEYLRNGDKQRIVVSIGDVKYAEYVTDKSIISVATATHPNLQGNTPSVLASIRPNAGRFTSVAMPNPWGATLMALPSKRGAGTQPLDEHISDYLKNPAIRRDSGMAIIFDRVKNIEIALDPKFGYLISRHEAKHAAGNLSPPAVVTINRENITSFQEVAPGVFFPREYLNEELTDGRPSIRQTVSITDVMFNKHVDDAEFAPALPRGAKVSDAILGTEYVIGPDGTKSGDMPLGKVTPGPVNPESASITSGGVRDSDDDGPQRNRWLLPLFVSISLAGIAIWLTRRRRRSI